MGFFKNKGSRKTATVTVADEEFTLTEPSAYDRTVYIERLNEHFSQAQENNENVVKQNQIWFSLNCYLIAVCLVEDERFKGNSVDEIWKMAKSELTEDAIGLFISKAEEVSNLKLAGNDEGSPDEISPEN